MRSKNLWKEFNPNLDGLYLLPSLISKSKFYGVCFVRRGGCNGKPVEFAIEQQLPEKEDDDCCFSVHWNSNKFTNLESNNLLEILIEITQLLNNLPENQNQNYKTTDLEEIFSELLKEEPLCY